MMAVTPAATPSGGAGGQVKRKQRPRSLSTSTTSTTSTTTPHHHTPKKRKAQHHHPHRSVRLHDHCATEEQRLYRSHLLSTNPHIAQALFTPDLPPTLSLPFTRTLSPTFPTLPYRERRHELRSTVPWGQRRLFLAELEFLTLHLPPSPSPPCPSPPPPTLVYAGGAPGQHVGYLASLFPALPFHLYDPSPFHIPPSSNVHLHPSPFTDSTALTYAGTDPLFISDVRTADVYRAPLPDVERAIEGDMADAMRWVELMQPRRALLRFRLPWSAGSTMYLRGELRLPVWGSQTTTECRLVPDVPLSYTTYQHRTYEQQMFHFNTTHRVQMYEREGEGEEGQGGGSLAEQLQAAVTGQSVKAKRRHHDPALSGLDHCYDCTAELHIIRGFLLAHPEQQERLRALVTREKGGGQEATALSRVAAASAAAPAATSSSTSVIASSSPASVLSAGLAQQTAVIEQVIPGILQAMQLQSAGTGQRMEQEKEAQKGEKEVARGTAGNAAVDGGKGGEDGLECVCLACLCVVMSDELSSELREGRTLLTAPLQPSAIGTANAKARKSQQRAMKKQQQSNTQRAQHHTRNSTQKQPHPQPHSTTTPPAQQHLSDS